ncbi:MAG: DUF6240 domain-containing protein [Lachnospiraceae bacterium]|nr:DUF6240 domain-containing protein [Lachnospiraceae bacterium]
MKIETGNIHHDRNVDMEKTAYGNSRTKSAVRMTDKAGGFTLDISGTVTDNAAYGMGELKSAEEVMQDAGQKDIALQRNYMAVMSNSMSAEDYKKMQEEGISATDTDIETHVTSLDKLKARLAESGTVIEGFNDDLSNDKITAIAGGDIAAEQLKEIFRANDLPLTEENIKNVKDAAGKAEGITGLSDDVRKYMVINDLEPTIANLYKAEYSAGAGNGRQARGYYLDSTDGYYAKKADVIDMDQIRGQVEGIIERAGLEVNEETMKEAEWIIRSGLPITEKTIGNLDRLNNLTLPLSITDVVNISAVAINDGKLPVNGSIDKAEPDHVMAVRVMEQAESITDGALERVVTSGKELNIKNLYDASAVKEDEQLAVIPEDARNSLITARRQLEETRLMMSTEANLKLLKQGISIDTEPLGKLVEELKEAERAYYGPLLINRDERGTEGIESTLDERIDILKQTNDVFSRLRTIPAEILGRINTRSDAFTAGNLVKEGDVLKASYEKAGKSYETLMTAPRADMGDSIRKAFGNVDDILKDNGFELNDANRKAVRILGYSQTAINPETINMAREADRAVERVMELMTPAKTLEIIREGGNPIDDNIFKLQNRLEQTPAGDRAERYSRFLRKLEERGQISDREKEAFVGMYRLFRQIEKSDGKLIGNVLSSGGEPTLRNLLAASRSNRAQGMDLSVDDEFGGLTDLNRRGTSISEQIDTAFAGRGSYLASLASETLDKLSPEGMINAGFDTNTTLESFAGRIREGYDKAAEAEAVLKEDMNLINEARSADDKVIGMLRDFDQPVTVNNLLAANDLMMNRGRVYGKLFDEADRTGAKDKLSKAAEKLADEFVARDRADEAYEQFTKEALKTAEDAVDASVRALDVKELKLMHKELSVAGSLARQQNYEVPVNIDGEWTSINLRLVSGRGDEGSVTATMETAEYGRVAAKFIMTGKECKGYITCDRQDGTDRLKALKDELEGMISRDGRTVKELDFVRSDRLDLNDFAREEGEGKADVDTADLYETAKAFIKLISRGGNAV